ncbi:MAG: aspartyl protease family protein, partial [Acidobacteria bacterium]|nr:aspartyl protease family protein [Acidobacteriota bacterium]
MRNVNELFRVQRLFVLVCLAAIAFSIPTFAADDVQKVDLTDVEKQIKEAKKLSRKGKTEEATRILKGVIARNPQNTPAKLELAYILLKSRQVIAAFNYSYDIAKAEPDNSFAFAILGTVYLSAGNFSEARQLLVTSIRLDKRQALAWAGMGLLEFYENRINQSILNMRQAVNHDPDEPDFAFALGQVAARAEEYKEAARAYKRFLRISPKNDDERRERIKGLIKFLDFLGNRSSLYDLGGDDEASLKMKLVNDRPVVQLRISSDGEPLNFVLDTGSGMTVISHETAKRLKIKEITKGGWARALGGDGKFQIIYGFLNKVYFGDAKVRNVPVYIREFHNKGEDVDGYIGLSLISKYITTIDYGNGMFTLEKKDTDDRAYMNEEGAMTLPLRLTSSGFLSGEVKLDGIEPSLNFIVDTGASVSVISKDLAGTQELSPYLSDETMRVIGAAGVTENVPSFLLPGVTFGKFSRTSLKAIALDLDMINETSGFEQAGILGGNFLKNYRLTFDFRGSKVT